MGLLIGIPGVLIGYEVCRAFFLLPWRVRRSSLPALLRNGERVWIDRTALGLRLPFSETRVGACRIEKGDLVAYAAPSGAAPGDLIADLMFGRIAAGPGASVRIDNGEIQVDGQAAGAVGSPPKPADWLTRKRSTVPEKHYLILADPESGAQDSRTMGWVPVDSVLGPVAAVWWPLHRARRVRRAESGA
jgi:signal peptidase I